MYLNAACVRSEQRQTMNEPYTHPHRANIFLCWLARLVLRLRGWKIVGPLPPYPKLVIIAYPHTSNWDGFYMVMTAWSQRIHLQWMGKHALFKPPFGWLIRQLGGVPIDRRAKHNVVEQAVQAFNQEEEMLLVVAPESTRKKVEGWKTGFYHIAMGAGVPFALAAMDYSTKQVRIHYVVQPTGDIEADLAKIQAYFAGAKGLHPEKQSPIRLLPRS
jgi:1-acyl-sn-glycerol-3-phosphate acyltransferase